MNISHRQLKMFVTLAKHLNFTHAAKALHITQPAISMQIKQLEEEIGLQLFEILGKKIYLTAAGEQTLRYAENILRELAELDYAINDLKGIKRGHLKIAVANSLSSVAAKILGKFQRQFPEIDISLVVGNRQQQNKALIENSVDLAITGSTPQELDIESHKLMLTHILVISSPQHPLVGKKKITLETLGEEKFIYGEIGSGTRVAMDHSLAKHHLDKSHIEVSNNEMVKHCIQEGMGVGLLPEVAVEMELKYNLLTSLNVIGFPLKYQINLVHTREKRLSLVATEFKNFALGRV